MDDLRQQRVYEIIRLYREGQMIIVTDDEDRENEGDLMVSSEKITAGDISFMAKNGRGLICIAIQKDLACKLELPLMTKGNNSQYSTAFTVSVDAARETTTGISAYDRLKTIRTILDENSEAVDLLRPGHMFPLIAAEGGLRERSGHTEAAIELARLSGHTPSGVICEIMGDDGTMTRGAELRKFADRFNLQQISIKEISEYLDRQSLGKGTSLPSHYGNFDLYSYPSSISTKMPHIALVHKEIDRDAPVFVRVHSECMTGDLFGSLRCDCGEQLKEALAIVNEEKGALLYLRQEGRGIGFTSKMEAYRLQDTGLDTMEANEMLGFQSDERDYSVASQMLKKLGISAIHLLTNNPDKISSLEKNGIKIVHRVPLEIKPNLINRNYLTTKKMKMNHMLDL